MKSMGRVKKVLGKGARRVNTVIGKVDRMTGGALGTALMANPYTAAPYQAVRAAAGQKNRKAQFAY